MFEKVSQPAEPLRAGLYALAVLASLLVAKSIGGVPLLGPLALGGAVFIQLWIPLSRCEAWGLPWSALGLDTRHLRRELTEALAWAAVILPLYAWGTALFYAHGAAFMARMLGPAWQEAIPVAHWGGVPWPSSTGDRAAWVWTCIEATLTHVLGVALPEEAFFRGYLQTQWQMMWPLGPSAGRPEGRGLGRAAVATCVLFALGHFVGEWHPGRLLPFFPGLLFAWQRNRRGSLVGCMALHAICNLFSAGWAACFVPGSPLTP